MAGRGSRPGERRGGRKIGTPNKATIEVRELALLHGPSAVKELARLCHEAQSETARIQACNAILERAYGRALPSRPIVLELPDTSSVEGITKAIAQIVQSVASGQMTPAEAGDLCSLLEAQRRAIELSDIEMRLSKLETAHGVQQ